MLRADLRALSNTALLAERTRFLSKIHDSENGHRITASGSSSLDYWWGEVCDIDLELGRRGYVMPATLVVDEAGAADAARALLALSVVADKRGDQEFAESLELAAVLYVEAMAHQRTTLANPFCEKRDPLLARSWWKGLAAHEMYVASAAGIGQEGLQLSM